MALLKSNSIKISGSFSRSTNVEIDYKDRSKLSSIFITSKFRQEILDLLKSIVNENSNQRVKVLSGSPGLGKSTYALLAANLVSKNNPRIIKRLLQSGEKKDHGLCTIFDKFQKSKKTKLLPVFFNGYVGSIEDAFVAKLKEAMNDIGLDKEFNIILRSISKNQMAIVKKWEKSFPEIHAAYCEALESEGQKKSAFEKKMQQGISSAKELFESIYSEITGGASSSTNVKNDIVGLYRKAIELLQKKGFAGIYVIYDEFGKYLEKGIHNPSLLNVQFLQDFAEYCDRSGKEQCHFTLITHLSVSQYATKLPLNIQKEWAKVEGRFQESSFFDRSTNHYKMISLVFEKTLRENNKKLNSKWKAFVSNFFKRFEHGKIGLDKLFESKNAQKLVEQCYPLHPVVLALLPILSQKVAQNERTLYTFLTRDEENSLCQFIHLDSDGSDLKLLTYSRLYEYFAPLVAKDTGIGGKYKIHLIYEESCNKLSKEDRLGRESVALISLLSIVKDNAFAPITENFIIACLSDIYEEKEVKKTIKNLERKKIFYLNKITKQFELMEGSSIDIDEEIKVLKGKELTSKDLVRLLENYVRPSYIVPNRYNFKHCVTRFFRGEMISFEEMLKMSSGLKPHYGKEDGILYYVIPFTKDELDQSRAVIKKIKNECMAFVLPKTFIECKADLEELNAVNALYANKDVINSGPLVRKELDRHKEILIGSIQKIVSVILGKTYLKAKCFYPRLDKELSIKHFSQLNRFLGDVFEEEYKHSIDFNSEYANKHKITGNIAFARKNLINRIMKCSKEKYFGIQGSGPEMAMAKALKQIVKRSMDNDKFVFGQKSSMAACLKKYKTIISRARGTSVEEIIDIFVSPPFGIRKGILPLLIAIWDKALEGPVNHYCEGKFITSVDGDHYDMLIKRPKICKIQYTEISKTKEKYIAKIAMAFNGKNITGPNPLLKAIFSWRKQIPEFTKAEESLAVSGKKLLVCIDSAQEPSDFIFKKIPESFGFPEINDRTSSEDIDRLIMALKEVVHVISNVYRNLIEDLHGQLVDALRLLQYKCLGETPFNYAKGMNLASIFQKTLMRFENGVKNYPFSKPTAIFLGRIKNFDSSKHSQYFVETVADALTNANPRNWNIKGKAMFEFSLLQAINEIETVAQYVGSHIEGESAIAFIDKKTGDKDFIKLGIITDLNKSLMSKVNEIEKIIGNLSEKDRRNLLVNLLRKKTEKVGRNGRVEL